MLTQSFAKYPAKVLARCATRENSVQSVKSVVKDWVYVCVDRGAGREIVNFEIRIAD
jgi:hypothetical protein